MINKFSYDLLKDDWVNVYKTDDVNKAYEEFLHIYLLLYNEKCPTKILGDKARSDKKPWITKGIIKACKKKNKLYRNFIKYRTIYAERQYKVYKNKLTSIMRQAKKRLLYQHVTRKQK